MIIGERYIYSGPCQMVFGWGGEIKNLGHLPFGAPSKFFFQKPKNFSGKYWGGGPQIFFKH